MTVPLLRKPVYFLAYCLTTLVYFNLPAKAQESPENTNIFKSLIENRESVLGEKASFFNKEIDHIATVNPFLLSVYLEFFNSNFRFPDIEKEKAMRRLIRLADYSYNSRIDLEIERLKKDTTINGTQVNYAEEVLQSLKVAESKSVQIPGDPTVADPGDYFAVYLYLNGETGLIRTPEVNYKKLVDSLASIKVARAMRIFDLALNFKTGDNDRLAATWRSSWFWLKAKGADPGNSGYALYKLILAIKKEETPVSLSIKVSGGSGYFRSLNPLLLGGPVEGMVNAPHYKYSYEMPNFLGYIESTISVFKDPTPFSEFSVGFWGSSASGTFSDPSEQVFTFPIQIGPNLVDNYTVTFSPKNTSWKSRFAGIYFLTNLWTHPYFKLEAGVHFGEQSLVFSGDLPYRGVITRTNTQSGYTYTRLD